MRGVGEGVQEIRPSVATGSPVDQTKMCVRAVLKARSTTLGHYRRGYPFFGYNDV